MGLHLIDGEKGGVGKSFFTTMMVEYCLDQEIPFRLVEADETTPDIKKAYPNLAEEIRFGNEEGEMKNLDELLIESQYILTLVNLPSRIKTRLDYWIERSEVLEIVKETPGFSLYKWFVITGQTESMAALRESLKQYGTSQDLSIPHMIVKNQGMLMESDWMELEKKEWFKNLLKKDVYSGKKPDGIKEVVVPKLSQAELSQLAEQEIALAKAKEKNILTVFGRRRYLNFLGKVFDSIENTMVLEEDRDLVDSNCEKNKDRKKPQPNQTEAKAEISSKKKQENPGNKKDRNTHQESSETAQETAV